ncbi:hypothetical protein FDG2_0501 [Candidatus Protofrankia californiensis]|uniref:Transport-associated OB type 2 domain-containing protein n=1 Tax=Candidatus Protofrankia californiensis TaxID=1839754 RepID=A0A1C3NTN9_9ACTN|nr:TOBE domain-containing protein [Protofrankia symbiont of Coriaria ruscifolia]SBW18079.1 hypothetical protein FDG2_0501 [Candidatus Protofrankia californiensis]
MTAGRIAQAGSPQEIYTSPSSPTVAAFVCAAVLVPAVISGQHARSELGELTVPTGSEQGNTCVLIRPEQIRLAATDVGDGALGQITAVRYFGHDATVHLRLDRSTCSSPHGSQEHGYRTSAPECD